VVASSKLGQYFVCTNPELSHLVLGSEAKDEGRYSSVRIAFDEFCHLIAAPAFYYQLPRNDIEGFMVIGGEKFFPFFSRLGAIWTHVDGQIEGTFDLIWIPFVFRCISLNLLPGFFEHWKGGNIGNPRVSQFCHPLQPLVHIVAGNPDGNAGFLDRFGELLVFTQKTMVIL